LQESIGPAREDSSGRAQQTQAGAGSFLRGVRAAGSDFWKGLSASMAESREVMNIRQASQYLGVSPDTLYKYVYQELIPAFKLGNRWRFKKSKLDQWMEEKSTTRQSRDNNRDNKKKPRAARVAAGH
jgi:excisionase family DNA binding protein